MPRYTDKPVYIQLFVDVDEIQNLDPGEYETIRTDVHTENGTWEYRSEKAESSNRNRVTDGSAPMVRLEKVQQDDLDSNSKDFTGTFCGAVSKKWEMDAGEYVDAEPIEFEGTMNRQ